MNAAFHAVIAARDDERRDLFLTTARRLGTAVQNVEKDFWVCWTLRIVIEHGPKRVEQVAVFEQFGQFGRSTADPVAPISGQFVVRHLGRISRSSSCRKFSWLGASAWALAISSTRTRV